MKYEIHDIIFTVRLFSRLYTKFSSFFLRNKIYFCSYYVFYSLSPNIRHRHYQWLALLSTIHHTLVSYAKQLGVRLTDLCEVLSYCYCREHVQHGEEINGPYFYVWFQFPMATGSMCNIPILLLYIMQINRNECIGHHLPDHIPSLIRPSVAFGISFTIILYGWFLKIYFLC